MTEPTAKPGRNIGQLFLDSGAHSLYFTRVKEAKKAGLSDPYGWFGRGDRLSKEFKAYIRAYAAFVRENLHAVDHFATVDVIYHPDLSLTSHRFLCELLADTGARPVPVIHANTDVRRIDAYLEMGHDFLGIGGFAQDKSVRTYVKWADRVFSHLCPASNGHLPLVRCHGFSVTSHGPLTRYPWYSVDSTTYAKMSAYGWLLIPPKDGGKYRFDIPYLQIGVSETPSKTILKQRLGKKAGFNASHSDHFVSPTKAKGKHTSDPKLRRAVNEWLDFLGVPLGKADSKTGEVIEPGVSNNFGMRTACNLRYFDLLCKNLPAYPWAFRPRRRGFV